MKLIIWDKKSFSVKFYSANYLYVKFPDLHFQI